MTARIDISRAIAPKSEQLNAEDLLMRPRNIRICGVSEIVEKNAKGEMVPKIRIDYEGGEGRPWKLSKTATRMLGACWGDDAAKWIGLSCTVYNDETVAFGGQEVGGIRVSHAEGLTAPRTLSLTVTRGKKKKYTIHPLVLEKKTPADAWKERLFAVANDPNKSVADAWALVKEPMRKELGEALYEQLLEMEKAAKAHATSDDAVLDDLNNQFAAE